MADAAPDEEIAAFLDRWADAMARRDIEAARRLRTSSYKATLPDGRTLAREQELAALEAAAAGHWANRIENVFVRRRGGRAVAQFDHILELAAGDPSQQVRFRCRMKLVRTDGVWQAQRLHAADAERERRSPTSKRLVARLWGSLRLALRRRSGGRSGEGYLPFAEGRDFVVPALAAPGEGPAGELQIPPARLWLGYDYPLHGHLHVETMMDIVRESGLAIGEGDRILDFGCGAGRMIRHLRPLAERCEIWGVDISAEHIFWCRDHLSPPFHFLTGTTAPHLPFADGSFRLIYAGSVFTHIVELAEAWLLELRRLLAADGRLYVTIHDHHTVELFGRRPYDEVPIVRAIKAKPGFRSAASDFAMLAVDRENGPQVFYDVDYFARLAAPALEVVSVTPEAYFYQTAVLMKPRG